MRSCVGDVDIKSVVLLHQQRAWARLGGCLKSKCDWCGPRSEFDDAMRCCCNGRVTDMRCDAVSMKMSSDAVEQRMMLMMALLQVEQGLCI